MKRSCFILTCFITFFSNAKHFSDNENSSNNSPDIVDAGFQISNKNIPSGFEHFFEPYIGDITVILYSNRITLMAEHSLNRVKILPESLAKLRVFLEVAGVDSNEMESIITSLSEGVVSSNECVGLIARCTLYPERTDYVFDDSNKQLKIFVNEKYLKFIKDKFFFEPNNTLSLINNSDIYGFVSDDGGVSFDFRNKNTTSLPRGYLKTDTSINWNNDINGGEFETYTALYTLDLKGLSIEAGYTEFLDYGNGAFSLLNGQNATGYHATLFSNDRMSKRNSTRFGFMSLFVPETTEVEIYREDKLMYRSLLTQGVHDISYSPFEEGIYNVSVLYKVGGQVIKEETRQIVNLPIFDMSLGSYDWFIRGGVYEFDYGPLTEAGYLKSGISYRPTERSILGASIEIVDEDLFTGFRHDYVLAKNVTSGLLGNIGFEGSSFLSAQIQYGGLGLYGEYFDANSDAATATYNSSDYRQLTATYSSNIFRGTYAFNYFYYKSSGSEEFGLSGFETQSFSLNVGYPIGGATLSGTLQYDFAINDNPENMYIGMNLNVPFDSWSVYSGVTNSSVGGSMITNTARYRKQMNTQNEVFLETSAISSGSQGTYSSGLFGVNHSSEYFDASGTVYGSTLGDMNASFSASNTQVLTKDRVAFTSRESESYLMVDNIVNSHDKNDSWVGAVEISNQSEGGQLVASLKGQSQLIPLGEHSQYSIGVSTGNSSFTQIEDVYETTFSKPGTVKQVINRLAKVEKYLVSFITESGDPVGVLNCSGEGCNSVEEIVDSVYQVSLFEGYDFVLHSGSDICLLPETNENGRVSNIGSSVCVSENTLAQMIKEMPEDKRLYYLGATDTLEGQNTTQINHIKVGDIYGRFVLSDHILDANSYDDLHPREVKFPIIKSDTVVSKEYF